jgi:hypothetical protein
MQNYKEPNLDLIKNYQFDIIELPSKGAFYNIGRRFLHIKYLTAKEENILCTPMLNERGLALDLVLKSVILEEGVNVEELLSVDRKAIILFLRSTSFGDSFEMEVQCPSCSSKNNHQFHFSDFETNDAFFDENGEFSLIFNLSEEQVYRIKLKPLTHLQEKIIKLNNKNKIITSEVIEKIVSINDNSDREYIEKFIKFLPLKSFQKLRKNIDLVLPSIIEKLHYTCSNCGHSESFDFEISDKLLDLDANYRKNFEEEIFLMQYYGKGGFDRESIYDMSVFRRRVNIQRINEEIEKKNKAEEEAVRKSKNKR